MMMKKVGGVSCSRRAHPRAANRRRPSSSLNLSAGLEGAVVRK